MELIVRKHKSKHKGLWVVALRGLERRRCCWPCSLSSVPYGASALFSPRKRAHPPGSFQSMIENTTRESHNQSTLLLSSVNANGDFKSRSHRQELVFWFFEVLASPTSRLARSLQRVPTGRLDTSFHDGAKPEEFSSRGEGGQEIKPTTRTPMKKKQKNSGDNRVEPPWCKWHKGTQALGTEAKGMICLTLLCWARSCSSLKQSLSTNASLSANRPPPTTPPPQSPAPPPTAPHNSDRHSYVTWICLPPASVLGS